MSTRQRQLLAPNPAPAVRTVQAPRGDTERWPSTRRDLGGLLLQLQRCHGNHFVQQLVACSATAPDLLSLRDGPDLGRLTADEPTTAAPAVPLVVGAAHDPAEAAADRIAATVVGSWPAGAEPELATSAGGPRIHRRATAGDAGGPIDGETSRAVGAAQRSGGAPLGTAIRSRMETALGTDLSGVRVHADARARDLCDTVRAHAFSVGQHVFFRRGLPDLGNAAGRHLLAHELAHVTQQSPPTVIRRTYLDGGDDWIERTTRLQRGTGLVKPRSAALRRIDDAVVRARAAYRDGSLPRLSNDLQALVARIAEWRSVRPVRMRAAEVDALDQEAKSLTTNIGLWRGPRFKQKLTEHQEQLNRVEKWLNKGSFDKDIRLRNSVEWVRRRRAKLFVLTETADREYRARLLLGRKPTMEEATYFPNPNSGRGALGDGTAQSHMYNPIDAADQKNVVLEKRINGWNRPGYIAVTDVVTDNDDNRELFFQTLRHEVQHDADKHRGPELSHAVNTTPPGQEQEFQKALRMYKTEYRAHSYQGGPALTVPPGADTRGRQWDQGQFAVFEHIRTDYPKVRIAVGGNQRTQEQDRFITAAHGYRNPDTEGYNKYNSVRIDDLYLALREVQPGTEDVTDHAVVEVLRAARALNYSDAAYIVARGPGEEAFMLRAMIGNRLAGAARDAFDDVLDRTYVLNAPPRRPRKKENF